MKILAIDTSCDDTAVAISEDRRILANIFWSKLKVHNDWGGVVPSEAKRQHEEFLPSAIDAALEQSKVKLEEIDCFAVTYGPGLAIALEPGLQRAKELATLYKKPLIPVNHMLAHIYANLAQDEGGKSLSQVDSFEFPSLALTISGGHTDLYNLQEAFKFELIGTTLDDAIGEAFDKVGRLLGLGFPAGHKVEQLAKTGDKTRFKLPHPLSQSPDFNWSYSGLKTAVLYELNKLIGRYQNDIDKGALKIEDISSHLEEKDIADMAASFQFAAIESLCIKIKKALLIHKPKMLIVGGGVIANSALRERLSQLCEEFGVQLVYPSPMWLCTDNAAMIATAGYFYCSKNIMLNNVSEFEKLDRKPSLTIKTDIFLNN